MSWHITDNFTIMHNTSNNTLIFAALIHNVPGAAAIILAKHDVGNIT